MKTPDTERMAKACQTYGALLQAYPACFRREYADSMALQFRDECRTVLDSRKRFPLMRLWLFILFDFVRSLIREHQEEVATMVKKNFFMYTALAMAVLSFLTFIFWFGPYYDTIEIGFFAELLLFPILFMILSAITLFGLASSIHSHVVFLVLTLLVLLSSLLFFPIPHTHPVRGTVYSTAIEYIGGNEDSAFGIIFTAYCLLLLTFAILSLGKKKWLPGIALLMLSLPVLIPYAAIWLSIEIPFIKQGEGEWFAITYGVLSLLAWFIIAWWFFRENKTTTLPDMLEAA